MLSFMRQHIVPAVGLAAGGMMTVAALANDAWNLVNAGLPNGAWTAIGATIFILSVIAILYRQHRVYEEWRQTESQQPNETERIRAQAALEEVRRKQHKQDQLDRGLRGQLPHVSVEELSAHTYLKNKAIKIIDLVDNKNMIQGRTFEGCRIFGPAVLFLSGKGIVYDCGFEGAPEQVFWELAPEQKQIVGAVRVEDCTFRGCDFFAIGFVGLPERMKELRSTALAKATDSESP